ncbi:MAG: family transporter [Actinomycetota bacterium]|nr:family transporter [Actinomycetota bacterium]
MGVTAIWGSAFVLTAKVIAELPVFTFLAWRFAIATLVLLVLRPRALGGLGRRDVARAAGIGLFLGGGYMAQTWGLQTTPATVSGFITGMFLVFTPLVAWLVTREAVSGSAWLAVAVATVGLAVLSLDGLSVGVGEMLTLLGALLFAVQIVGLSLWSTREKAYGYAVVQLGVVALMSAVVTPFEPGPAAPPTAAVWVGVVFLALFATSLAFVVQSWSQSQLAPTQAAVILTMEPVFAGMAGFLAGEQITSRMLLGGALVLTAMYLVELGPRRAREAQVSHLEP